jgi:methionine-rich copper-binding protein CopC
LLLVSPASAHNVLVGSSPADGASVSTGPGTVRLNFNAPVQEGPNVLTVIGPDGQHWEKTENATVLGDSVSTTVAPLGPAGRYAVGYRIISADGHPVSGEVTFTLTKPGTGKPVQQNGSAATGSTTTESAAAPSGGGGAPVWPWILGGVVLLAGGLVLALRLGGAGADKR